MDLQGHVRTVTELPFFPAGFEVRQNSNFLVADALRRKLYQIESNNLELVGDLSNVARFHFGESVVDCRGGVYVDDVGFDFLNPLVDPVANGVIVYLGADGNSSVVADDLSYPTGLAITPNNSMLIVGEMLGHRLTSFDIENDGSLRNRRVWAQFENTVKPHGVCIDIEGSVWVAGSSPAALHVQEGGEITQQIRTERPVFDITLGGPQRRQLFLCTAESSDPLITRRTAGASIEVAEVATPGYEFCC